MILFPLAIDLAISAEDVGITVVALFVVAVAAVGIAAWVRS